MKPTAIGWMIALCATLNTVKAQTRPAPANMIDATSQGIVGDGAALDSVAIQKAIDALSARGGGTLRFPAGRYITGTVQLKDHVKMYFDEGATLLGSTDASAYRNLDPFTAGDGVPLGYALIFAMDAHDVGISGPGTIDGQGKAVAAKQKPYNVRPFLIRWVRCSEVSLEDVHLQSPGAWTNQFFQCNHVSARNVTIRSATTGLRNNDGIDIDSCQNVMVSDCDIESGDDAICMKTTSTQPCKDITISNCKLKTRCNAIKLGTESIGDFQNISVSHCQVRDTNMAGVAMYCVDGGHMEHISVSDVTMDGIVVPISLRLGARLKTFREGQTAKDVGVLRDISVRNIKASRAKNIGLLINGIPGHPIEGLTLENIQIELAGGGTQAEAEVELQEKEDAYPEYSMFGKTMPAYGVYLRHVAGISMKNVSTATIRPDERPEKVAIDVVP